MVTRSGGTDDRSGELSELPTLNDMSCGIFATESSPGGGYGVAASLARTQFCPACPVKSTTILYRSPGAMSRSLTLAGCRT